MWARDMTPQGILFFLKPRKKIMKTMKLYSNFITTCTIYDEFADSTGSSSSLFNDESAPSGLYIVR